MFYVGLDVHQRSSALCILDKNGKLVKRLMIRGHRSKVVEALGKLGGRLAVCYEASCGYGWHPRRRAVSQHQEHEYEVSFSAARVRKRFDFTSVLPLHLLE